MELDNTIPPLESAAWLKAAHELVRFDEVELALKLLDMVPAYYRDYPLNDIQQAKKSILSSMVTPHAYINGEYDNQNIDPDSARQTLNSTLRGTIVKMEVSLLNKSGVQPHVVDMGPGEYFMAIGMAEEGLQFTYQPVGLDDSAYSKARQYIAHLLTEREPNQPTVFLAQEIIEHLHNPLDIATEALRHCGGWPDYVHLSTPLYTFDASPKKERLIRGGLPHLRAYTPREFINEAYKIFPGYTWEYKTDALQSLRGFKVGGAILGD